jgi:PTH1 family peptidyl-tRNA hydrolase
LSDFSATERKEIDFLIDRAADATEALIERGLDWSQNAYHAA